MTTHPSEMKHTRWASLHRQLTDDYGVEFTGLTLAAQGMVIGDVCAALETGEAYDDWKLRTTSPRGVARMMVDMHHVWGVDA